MDKKWFFTLPDFDNEEEWIEERPMDLASNDAFSQIVLSSLGSAPTHLYLGLVIRKRNRKNLRLILDAIHLPNGRGLFILKWWIEGGEEKFGIAAKLPDRSWRICSEKEIPCWILNYNEKKKRMRGFGITFKVIKKGEFN